MKRAGVDNYVYDETKDVRYVRTGNDSSNGEGLPDSQSLNAMLDLLHNLLHEPKPEYDRHTSLEQYEIEKAKVKSALSATHGQVSLSADLWITINRHGKKGEHEFVSFSVHFVDDQWELRKWILSYQLIDLGSKSPCEAVVQSLKDWGIEKQASTFTWYPTDNEDHDKCVDLVKIEVQAKKQLLLHGQLFHVKCCAWMFKSMVQDAFKEISTITDKISTLTRYRFDTITRWSNNLVFLKYALKDHLAHELEGDEIISEDEWSKVKSLMELAGRAYHTAKVLFDTKYQTANIYLYKLLEFRENLMREESSCSFTSHLAKIMLTKLDAFFESNFWVLTLATVLDPRFKMKGIVYISTNYKRFGWDPKCTVVEEAIRSLYKVYVEAEDKKCDRKEEKSGDVENSDLESYLEEIVEDFSEEFDVLAWWKNEEPKYPIMAKIARDILGIPLSVAVADDALYPQREAEIDVPMSDSDFVNAVMCLNSWSARPTSL